MTPQGWSQFVADGLVVAHLCAMAVAPGAVLRADRAAIGRLRRPVSAAHVAIVQQSLSRIRPAPALLRISGAALFALRTGLAPSRATAQHAARLAMVLTLAVLALAVIPLALSRLPRRRRGLCLIDPPLGDHALQAGCGGLLAGCGSLAPILGAARGLHDIGPGCVPAVVAVLAPGITARPAAAGPVAAFDICTFRCSRHRPAGMSLRNNGSPARTATATETAQETAR